MSPCIWASTLCRTCVCLYGEHDVCEPYVRTWWVVVVEHLCQTSRSGLSRGGPLRPALVGFGAGVVEGPEEDRGDLVLNGTLVSANCGLALALEGSSSHLAQHYAKAIRYTACMTALALLQVRLSGWSPCRLVPEVVAVIIEGSCREHQQAMA